MQISDLKFTKIKIKTTYVHPDLKLIQLASWLHNIHYIFLLYLRVAELGYEISLSLSLSLSISHDLSVLRISCGARTI